jgi:hypothetical protein
MTVFSEKVQPTFTNSDLNVIIVKDFNEIFFDVFELEINGNKFVAEKVSEKNGKPIISLPIEIDGTKFNTNFLLEKGNRFEIYYNGETGSKALPVKSKTNQIFDEPPVNIFEKKEPLIEIPDIQYAVDNIKLVKESAAKHIAAMQKKYEEQYQLKEKRAASKNIKELESIRGEFKGELISDFYKITESLKNQIADYNLAERAEWDKHFSDIFEEYSNSVDRKIEDNFQQVISKCENKIFKLTDDIFTEKLISIIESKSNEIEEAILDSQRVAFNSLDKKSKSIDLQVVQNKKELIGIVNEFNIKYTESLTSIRESSEREGIEISRSVNKALSRIGNIRTVLLEKLSTDISRVERELKESIVEREGFIKDYFNNKIKILNEKFTELSDDYKEEIITLIQESEQRILDHTSSVSTALPTLILKEAKNGKNKDNVKVSLEGIRKELEGNISNRFSSEIVSLKRLIEMTSGGGGGGGPSTGGISVETDPVFTTWAYANSANYDLAYNTILTGGNIGGNLNVTGNISGENIYSNNIISLENKLEAVYSYLIQNFENTYIATSVTINDFVSYEWSEGLNLRPGDILLLSGANIAYILGESDGSGLNDYYQVNLKPNFIFFKANLSDYSPIDTFPLSSMKSSKYILQVEDIVNNDIFYCELNVISNGVIATVTEYGSNYSTNEPFVEFGAETDGIILSLSATGLGRDMSNFIIKGNRTNIF